MTFNKSEFLASTHILNTKFNHFWSQNNNLFCFFNNQINYALGHYFVNLKTTKCNINKFFTNFLIKFIINNLLYFNTNKQIKKLSFILQEILDDKQVKYKLEFESGVNKIAR